MNKNSPDSHAPNGDAGLARLGAFEEERARVPLNSARHRELTAAIGVEADAYRKSLDAQQAQAARKGQDDPFTDRMTRG